MPNEKYNSNFSESQSSDRGYPHRARLPKSLDSGRWRFYIKPLSILQKTHFIPIRFLAALGISLALHVSAVVAQGGSATTGAPPREVRAVWITTVAGLDWPTSRDTAVQRATLLAMVERLHAARFNTIFFQVRGRGDALYRSSIEPWSSVLTGRAGGDPGWDPLGFILDAAHARGMEVHAWFNTYLVKGGKEPAPATKPAHVMNAHPGWVLRSGDQWWLDPGEPGVEAYLVEVARDIVTRYPVDGFHLDYMRYPGRSFGDDATYARYGSGLPRDEWRRRNVTRFLGRIRAAILEIDPLVKLGVAPIGIYRNPAGVRGLESYSDVYQDTHHWTELRLVDYVVPQLYWPVGGANGDPDFGKMADHWRGETRGCQLYLGIGSYKEEVLAQSDRLVALARSTGAEGHAFFRYTNIEPLLPLRSYASLALPPAMAWKDSVAPEPPAALTVSPGGGIRLISWTPPAGGDEPGGWYALYRISGTSSHEPREERLIAVLPSSARSAADTVGPGVDEVWYALTRLDRSWNESHPVGVAAPAASPVAARVPEREGTGVLIGVPREASGTGRFFLPVILDGWSTVDISVRARPEAAYVGLFRGGKRGGGHVITLDLSGFGPGTYRCRVVAGAVVSEREIRVGR